MKEIIYFCIFAILTLSVEAAGFVYDPLQIILKATHDGHSTEKVVFYNPSSKPTRLQLSFSEWEISDISEIKILEQSEIIDYIKANPQQFTLAPFEEKEIKITCLLPSNYDDKEYKLFLNILEIGYDRKANDNNLEKNKKLVNKQIRAGTYIRKGNLAEGNLKIQEINVRREKNNNFKYEILYENHGLMHMREPFEIAFYDQKNNLIGKQNLGFLIAFPTKANSLRTFKGQFSFSALPKNIEFNFIKANLIKKVQL